MIVQAFALFDTKSGVYGTPFFMAHTGQAIRAVQDLCADMNTTVARHPADFALIKLGVFDDNNATFTNSFENIGPCVSFLEVRTAGPLFSAVEA